MCARGNFISRNVAGVPGEIVHCLLGGCALAMYRLAHSGSPEDAESSEWYSCRVLVNPVLAWFSKCSVVGSAGEVEVAVSSQGRIVSKADRHLKKACAWSTRSLMPAWSEEHLCQGQAPVQIAQVVKVFNRHSKGLASAVSMTDE